VARTGNGAVIVLPANPAVRVVPAGSPTATPTPAQRSGQPVTIRPVNIPPSTAVTAPRLATAPAATPPPAVRPASAPGSTSPAATRPRELPETTPATATRPAATPGAARPATVPAVLRPAAPAAPARSAEPSPEAAKLINWVVATRDNGDRPFIVIDKVAAQLFVFDPRTHTRQSAPVLVGIAKGDTSMPGIGDLELAQIPVSERTTPAGRFLASFGPALDHEPVLWVDEPNAVSLHAVVTSNPREQRLARLASATPDDNRITFGCINVDAEFYGKYIEQQFRQGGGVVYILPESRPLTEVFAGIPREAAPSASPGAKPGTQLASSKSEKD